MKFSTFILLCIVCTTLLLAETRQSVFDLKNELDFNRSWFDSLNVRFVGNWPFGWSNAVTYDATRRLVFSSSGGGAYIFDVSDPNSPTLLSTMLRTRGFINYLYYHNNTQLLYTAGQNAGIEIWDVSDANLPIKIGFLSTPDFCSGIFVQDTIAFIANGYSGLGIINVSDPSNPQEIIFYDTPDYANKLIAVDSLIYIADLEGGLRIINVAEPSNPFEIGYFNRSDTSVYDIFVVDSFAYVAARDYDQSGCGILLIFNIADPTNPYVIGRCFLWGHSHSLYVSGSYAYVANDRLSIVDISDPSNPFVTFFYNIPVNIKDVYISGSLAFLSARGFRVVDVSDPFNPRELSFYDTRNYTKKGICIKNSYGYVIASGEGLRIIDISNPDSIHDIGHCHAPGFYDQPNIFVTDTYAFLITGSIEPTFFIIDITSYLNPVVLCSLPNHGYRKGLYIFDTLAYISDGYIMSILNIADVFNPVQVSQYYAGDEIHGIFIKNNYAYVVTNQSLRIVDVTFPTHPEEISSLNAVYYGSDVLIENGYAYIAQGWDNYNGLIIVDVQDPFNPHVIGSCSTHYPKAYQLRKDNDFVYLSCGFGMEVIDVTDPAQPISVGYYDSADWSLGLAVSNSMVFTAAWACGVQVYENLLTGVRENKTILVKKEHFGSTIFSGPLILPKDKFCKVFDITGREVKPHLLAPGIYFIEINGKIIQKVVKVR